jgi:MoaA/NifB/PqqE/SkfB family radical SAM enzyme
MTSFIAEHDAVAELSFLWLEITGKCQLHCTHCYAESGPRETHGVMTDKDSDIRKSVNRTHPDVRFLSGIARRNLLKLR